MTRDVDELVRELWTAIGAEGRAFLAERTENPTIVEAVASLASLAHHTAFNGRCAHLDLVVLWTTADELEVMLEHAELAVLHKLRDAVSLELATRGV